MSDLLELRGNWVVSMMGGDGNEVMPLPFQLLDNETSSWYLEC